MQPEGERIFLAADGEWYRARLSPCEHASGVVLPEFNAVSVETWDRRWIGSVTIRAHWRWVELDTGDLVRLLHLARKRRNHGK